MLMFLQFVGSINCQRKKFIVSHLLIVKEKCYGGIILDSMMLNNNFASYLTTHSQSLVHNCNI